MRPASEPYDSLRPQPMIDSWRLDRPQELLNFTFSGGAELPRRVESFSEAFNLTKPSAAALLAAARRTVADARLAAPRSGPQPSSEAPHLPEPAAAAPEPAPVPPAAAYELPVMVGTTQHTLRLHVGEELAPAAAAFLAAVGLPAELLEELLDAVRPRVGLRMAEIVAAPPPAAVLGAAEAPGVMVAVESQGGIAA